MSDGRRSRWTISAVVLSVALAPLAGATTAGAAKAKLPGRPSITSILPGPGSLTVSWQAGSPGSQTTNGFRVTVSQAGVTLPACAGVTRRSCTISGLTPGLAAKVSVAERSALGVGAPATAKATPTGAPAAPTSLVVQRVGSTIVATWKAGSANGSPITGFLVGAVSGTGASLGGCSSPWAANAKTCTFVGASASDSYVVSVAGVNAVGTGRAASSSVGATSPTGGTPRHLASSISLSQRWVQPGGQLTVTGSHFARSATIQLSARRTTTVAARTASPKAALAASSAGTVPLGSMSADATGAVSGSITIPTSLPAGSSSSFEIVASGSDDAGATGTVTAPVLIGFDTTGPQLLGSDAAQPLTVSSSGSDTSFGPQTVTITAEVTDDLSGVGSVWLQAVNADGRWLRCGFLTAALISGDSSDGVWQQTCTAPKYAAGDFRVFVTARDAAANDSNYTWSDRDARGGEFGSWADGSHLDGMGYSAAALTASLAHPEATGTVPPSFGEAGSPDGITLGTHDVTLTPGEGAVIPVSFGFTSPSADASWFSFLWQNLNPPPGASWPNMRPGTFPSVGAFGDICPTTCPGPGVTRGRMLDGTLSHGVFSGQLQIPAGTVDGVYELTSATIDDGLRNSTTYGPALTSSLDSLGYAPESLSIVVHSAPLPPHPDGPQMLDVAHGGILSLSTNAVDSVAGPQSVDVTVGGFTADAGYNVATVMVTWTDGTKVVTPYQTTPNQATALSDPVTLTMSIPQFADPGTWRISMIWLFEWTVGGGVMAWRTYDPAQLGFDPSAYTFTNQHVVGS